MRAGHTAGVGLKMRRRRRRKVNLIPLLLPQTCTSKMPSRDVKLPQLLLQLANEANEN